MRKFLHSYSDSELTALLLEEDEVFAKNVFAELYGRFERRIYAYCLRVTGCRDDAGDITQDTFIKFYHVARKRHITHPSSYLLITARNKCLNFNRDRTSYEPLFEHTIIEESLHSTFEQRDLLAMISKALPLLDFDRLEAFVLRYWSGLDYKEMAEVCGESINVMRTRVWRAKERLKEILAPFIHEINNL
ncbi:MAG: sigma-70 family RNA polymerase sigma factor [Ignavibacteria bacterium]|nr:sigma-70 family RNA polymerase sigma factor [Ignavibacteria bacterium]